MAYRMFTRRFFLKVLAGLPFFAGPSFLTASASSLAPIDSRAATHTSIGRTFAGEELHYNISFGILGRVAVVRMSFAPGTREGIYESSIRGETVGLTGFITRYRKDIYHAVMEELDDGERLRSVSFEEEVRIGDESRKRTHTFDHDNKKWTEHNVRMSKATSTEVHEIPEGRDYNDFLTASYNFRYGVYGTVERGKAYHVPVFPKKGVDRYDVRVASTAEENRLRKRGPVPGNAEYRIELAMDPEVLQSEKGLIKGWLSRDLYPVEGVMEDVFLFGDVRGTLVKRIDPRK